jgi:alcohol-forming fatty acyl-CoA reductase
MEATQPVNEQTNTKNPSGEKEMDAKNRNEKNSEITEFYRNKSIFLTGVTGQLGKCVVEKLLRACTQLDKIYLLVRPKKGKNSEERLAELVDCKVINKIY